MSTDQGREILEIVARLKRERDEALAEVERLREAVREAYDEGVGHNRDKWVGSRARRNALMNTEYER